MSWGSVRARERVVFGILRLRVGTGSDVMNQANFRFFVKAIALVICIYFWKTIDLLTRTTQQKGNMVILDRNVSGGG